METAVKFPDNIPKDADTVTSNRIAGAARCLRCGGLMVVEPCTDFWDHTVKNITVRRCVQCGELIDPVILQNRHAHRAGAFGPSER
jgi:hypothetical protein